MTTPLPALKGRTTTAQGNALGAASLDTRALKGRHNRIPTGTNPHLWAHGSTLTKRPERFEPPATPLGWVSRGVVTQGSALLHPGLSPCAALRRGRARGGCPRGCGGPPAPTGQPVKARGGTPGSTSTKCPPCPERAHEGGCVWSPSTPPGETFLPHRSPGCASRPRIGYRLPTLRVEDACDRDGVGTTDGLEAVAAASGVCGSSATCRRFRQVSASCRKKPVSSTCPTDVSKVGVLEEQSVGREKLFIHPKLMGLLTREPNAFTPYP